jgi:hypothetical protein
VDSATRPDTRHDTTRLLSVHAAATALGISAGAIRKRIERGQLRAERHHGRWYVDLDGATAAPRRDHDKARTRRDTTNGRDVALIEQLRDENRYLRERLVAAEAAQAEMRRLVLAADARALPAPGGSISGNRSGSETDHPHPAPDVPVAPRSRPWWARWLRGDA